MKSKIIAVALTVLVCAGCRTKSSNEVNAEYKTLLNPAGEIGIVTNPIPADYSFIFGNKKEFPALNENTDSVFKIDIRSADLSAFNLLEKEKELNRSTFDSKTIWPNTLPDSFQPNTIMELGKDPGLQVRKLHSLGVTGENIGIAIIDQTLLVDHVEYKDQLRFYEEIHNNGNESSMHGPAVASIAVGKTVGVAPGADLYYIAETHGTFTSKKFLWDLTYLADSIDRICEINRLLPQDKKIRVLSISLGVNSDFHNSKKALESIKKAEAQNIYVFYVGSADFMGMYRNPVSDPNDFQSYEPGLFWSNSYYDQSSNKRFQNTVMIPMDSRCTASPTGVNDYVFYTDGGMSWAVPYIAGVYALACQVYPKITPTVFWDIVRKTGEHTVINKNENSTEFGIIINPLKVIDEIKKLN